VNASYIKQTTLMHKTINLIMAEHQ